MIPGCHVYIDNTGTFLHHVIGALLIFSGKDVYDFYEKLKKLVTRQAAICVTKKRPFVCYLAQWDQ